MESSGGFFGRWFSRDEGRWGGTPGRVEEIQRALGVPGQASNVRCALLASL